MRLRLRALTTVSFIEEILDRDGTAQAEAVRRGEVRPAELVEAALERIDRRNPGLGAVVTSMAEQARLAAGSAPAGPFAGVPFLLKDLTAAYAGVRLTAGSAFLRDFVPDHDSELVARLKRAGLIALGKTSTPELGLLPTTEPTLFGPCRNPWDPGRTAGGSSGGSAAAVAAGLVAIAHGSDGGGSLRIPASCCGVFGLKPTRGRNSLGPDFGDVLGGLLVEHALTRSVRDSAALLDATHGAAPGDPYAAPPPEGPFAAAVGAPPGRLRIAWTTASPLGTAVDPECVAAVEDAADLCDQLGHELVEAAPDIDPERYVALFMTLWAAGCAWSVEGIALRLGRRPDPDGFEPLTWALYQRGLGVPAARYLLAVQGLQLLSRRVTGLFAEHDLWLTPTLAEPAVPLGTFDYPAERLDDAILRAFAFTPFTSLANVTGQPAMSVPLHWTDAGLPIGVQFVGRYGDEATLFRLAGQLEEARPWRDRYGRGSG